MGAAKRDDASVRRGPRPARRFLMTQSFDRHDHNDDEREIIRDHDAFSAAKEEESVAKEASARHDDIVDDSVHSDGAEIPNIQASRPRVRRTPTRNTRSKRNTTAAKSDSGIIQFSERTARNGQQSGGSTSKLTDDTGELSALRDLDELQSQGFTADEAIRLIHVSDRLANGREARESQTTLRRLRFTRWLIEHGVLDEFTA